MIFTRSGEFAKPTLLGTVFLVKPATFSTFALRAFWLVALFDYASLMRTPVIVGDYCAGYENVVG